MKTTNLRIPMVALERFGFEESGAGSRELLMPARTAIRFDGIHFDDEPEFNASSPDIREYVTDDIGASVVRKENAGYKGLIEGSLDATSIYPMREGTVSKVCWEWKGKEYETYDSAIAAGAKSNEVFCDFFDKSIPDNLNFATPDLLIAGEKATVIFQSGMLAGKEFEIATDKTGDKLTGYIHSKRRFKLVSQEIDGIWMPGGAFSPVPASQYYEGDRYAVFHIGMPPAYVLDAERRLLKEAVKYLYENEMPRFTFTGTLDAIWAKRDWENIGGRLVLGGFIRFSDTQFLPDGMDIRITGIKDYVNNPHKPEIELSNNSQSGSWLHSMQRKIESEEVLTEKKDREIVQYAKRRFRDVHETMELLGNAMLDFSNPMNPITIQTMQAIIGDKMLQYDFTGSKSDFYFDPADEKTFHAPEGTIEHKTLGINTITSVLPTKYPYWWYMSTFRSATLDDPNQAYYLYAVVPDEIGGDDGMFELSAVAKPFNGIDENGGYYFNLLVGILNIVALDRSHPCMVSRKYCRGVS